MVRYRECCWTIEWDEFTCVESVGRQTLAFWANNGSAPDRRGYLTCLDGSGRPYDASTHNLIASSRFVVTFAMGARLFRGEQLREHAVAAFEFLGSAHRDAEYGGYLWSLLEWLSQTTLEKFCTGMRSSS